jgi:hypothetical protein
METAHHRRINSNADYPIQENVCISFAHNLPRTTENIKQELNLVIDGGQSDGDNLNPLHLSTAARPPQATSPSIAPDHSAPQGANHSDHLSAIPALCVDNPFLHVIDGGQSTASPTTAAELRDFALTTLRTVTDALTGPSSIYPRLKITVEVISSVVAIVDVCVS